MALNLDDRWRAEASCRSYHESRNDSLATLTWWLTTGAASIWRETLTVVRWIKAAQRCTSSGSPDEF